MIGKEDKMFQYTWSQFISLLFWLILIVGFSFTYKQYTKNKDESIKEIPLKVIAIVVVILELIKLFYNYKSDFLFDSLPLHFCHMYLLWLPLSVFTKGRFKHKLQCISVIACLYMTVLMYIFPSAIIGHSELYFFTEFGSFHNFIVHQLYAFFSLFSIINNIYKPEKNDYIYMMGAIVFYAIIGIPGANITKYNYALILQSNIPFIDNLFANVYPLYLLCYFALMMGICYVTTFGYYKIYSHFSNKCEQPIDKKKKD